MRVVPAKADKGSQYWLQRAVCEQWDDLNAPLLARCAGAGTLVWLSPSADDQFAEYRDAAFLARIGKPELASELRKFWPDRGPQWDGLATTDANHVILIEAKAHIGEFCSPYSQASETSLAMIRAALDQTAKSLGVKASHLHNWAQHFYQYANRLAHLHWLREHNVDAKLALVGFIGDSEMKGPASHEAWDAAYRIADHVLGLSSSHKLSKHVIHVFPDVAKRI